MKRENSRVLFLLTYYYPHWTGLTQYARRLAEGLASDTYSVTVLTTQHEKTLSPTEIIKKVTVVRKPVLFRLSRTLLSLEFIISFWKYIQLNDVVIVYLPFAEVFVAAIIAKILRKKLFLVHNGDLVLPKGLINRFIEIFFSLSTGMAIRLSSGILIQTQDYANHSSFLKKYTNKWRVVLPLYENHHTTRHSGRQRPSQNQIDPGPQSNVASQARMTIGFAGRFVEEKGFDILLQAIPLVKKHIHNVQFVFAGDTAIPYENFFAKNKQLLDANKQSLVLRGKLNQLQMAKFYKDCDVFSISSRTDCFPSTEVEALLERTPVVVTDIPGARWPVQQTGMGEIVQSKNPQALADGIIKVLKNKEKYKKNFENVKKVFDYEKTLHEYERVIK